MINNKHLNQELLRIFDGIRNRPLMFFSCKSDYNYVGLKIYLDAYVYGLSFFLGRNLNFEISRWFNKKVEVSYDIHWTDAIPLHYPNKSEEELKAILIDITEEYFIKHPDWVKAELPIGTQSS